jgi:hypothetical protein
MSPASRRIHSRGRATTRSRGVGDTWPTPALRRRRVRPGGLAGSAGPGGTLRGSRRSRPCRSPPVGPRTFQHRVRSRR